MSGPFGVDITLVSGQKSSGEIVVAAAAFLSMGFLSITVVSEDSNIRQEFLKALDIFKNRERIDYHDGPDYFAERLIGPNINVSTKSLFWLALDKEGVSIAKNIFNRNGELPEKVIYRSVQKLNLIEQTASPPPQIQIPLHIWEECRRQHFSLSLSYRKLKSKESYHSYMSKQASLIPEQRLYCDWCESLYESLIPWQDIIKKIQSDFS